MEELSLLIITFKKNKIKVETSSAKYFRNISKWRDGYRKYVTRTAFGHFFPTNFSFHITKPQFHSSKAGLFLSFEITSVFEVCGWKVKSKLEITHCIRRLWAYFYINNIKKGHFSKLIIDFFFICVSKLFHFCYEKRLVSYLTLPGTQNIYLKFTRSLCFKTSFTESAF